MIVIEITRRSDGVVREFRFEESLAEVTLRRFIDFKETVDLTKPDSLTKYEETPDPAERDAITAGLDAKELDRWQDYFIAFCQYWAGIPDDFVGELREQEIVFLYGNINRCLLQYTFDPQQTLFMHKGETYLYPPAPVNPFYNQKEYFKGQCLIDSITALQFDMFAKQLGKTQWSVLPKIVAIICKKKGEQLPLNSVVRERWIDERSRLFDSLPLSEALNVAFFLNSRKIIYQNDSSQYSILRKQDRLTKLLSKFGNVTAGKRFMSKLLHRDFSTVAN